MKTDTKVIIGAIVASVALIVGAVFVLGKDKSPQREQLGTGAMTLDKKEADLGDMKVTDERSATFTITNTSKDSILRIWGIATSCDCTFANVTINGTKTGEFNMTMHMNSTLKNWIGEVAPGQNAALEVIYRPKVMPVTGPITRQVNFSTNDPNNSEVQVAIKANVL